MAADTKIEWCDHTFNGWIGCTKVSIAATGGGGCDRCYAEVSTPVRVLRGKGTETWGTHTPRVRTSSSNWAMPKRWNAQAAAFRAQYGRRQRVFCASLSDWLDNAVDAEWLIDLLALVRLTPDLDWLLLSKRIGIWRSRLEVAAEAIRARLSHAAEPVVALLRWIERWLEGDAPANVWIGATVVNQIEADRDLHKLLWVPARVRFLSMEPLLGPVNLHLPWFSEPGTRYKPLLHWVIAGGESGVSARPMHPDWARSLRDQCQAVGVPFLFKQHGEWVSAGEPAFGTVEGKKVALIRPDGSMVDPLSEEGRDENADVATMSMVGKSAAGRLLDSRTWDQFPEARHGAA